MGTLSIDLYRNSKIMFFKGLILLYLLLDFLNEGVREKLHYADQLIRALLINSGKVSEDTFCQEISCSVDISVTP